ncbi:ankyrin [Wilcoxina mikolae CBS 423.85]|nr:ankyrin [Wilcoxina mikolae CBS 423.85]
MLEQRGQHKLKDALEHFQDALTPEQRSELLGNPAHPPESRVIELTKQIDAKKSRGSRRVLRFLESVNQFSSVVDTLIQSNPIVSALVWGSVKLAILVFYPMAMYLELVASFYATVIEFCTTTIGIFKDNGFKRFTKTMWKPFKIQFKEIEGDLQDQRDKIDLEIIVASETALLRERQEASLYRREGVQHRLLQIEHNEGSRDWRIQQDATAVRNRRVQLLARISSYNYRDSFSKALHRRREGTGRLVIDTPEFQQWFKESRSSGLWCYGIPGSGKTLLTAGIIDHIFSVCQGSAVSISYFFCDFANRQSLEICTVLRSLIKQILNVFVDKISPALERGLERAFIESPADPSSDQLFDMLVPITKLYSATTYLILDGLDECNDFDRRQLISYLQRLSRNRSQATSGTNSDIAAFITQELDERIQQKRLVVRQPGMIEEIQSALIEGSEGMYLWVAFQLDDICRENNDEDIRRVLKSLPRGLNETYGRILKRIVKDRKPEIAAKLFTWVAGARRPLSLLELAEAIAFEPGDSHWQLGGNRIQTDVHRMVQNCGNLVILSDDESDDERTVQFAHYTVLQYFLSEALRYTRLSRTFSLRLSEADSYIAKICLTYLDLGDFQTQIVSTGHVSGIDVLEIVPASGIHRIFSILAKLIWGRRQVQAPSFNVSNPTSHLRTLDTMHYGAQFDWSIRNRCPVVLRLLVEVVGKKGIRQYFRLIPGDPNMSFHSACSNGHYSMVLLRLLINDHPGSDGTALVEAARHGHSAVVDLVLAHAIAKWEDNRTAIQSSLQASAARGHISVVESLISAGANPNSISTFGEPTALQAAAAGGHLAVVYRLLSAGADVDARPSESNLTPLQAASAGGHLAVVDRLLSAGADAAALGGHLTVVDRLLSAGAIVDLSPGDGEQTPLETASAKGHVAVVQRLLSAGANITASSTYPQQSPLQAASAGGHLPIVDALLAVGANVNEPAAYDALSPLQAAAEGGHLVVVNRLIAAGADISWAFYAAAKGGNLLVVDHLLKVANDKDMLGYLEMSSALKMAAEDGNLEIVERLLEVVGGTPPDYVRALVVEALLTAGPDLNALHDGITALWAASLEGHLDVVERLLKAGVSCEVRCCYKGMNGKTAMEAAFDARHDVVIERLRKQLTKERDTFGRRRHV